MKACDTKLAEDLACWARATRPEGFTLRDVQREVPSRPIRREAAKVIEAAEAAALIEPLSPGSIVGGAPRKRAWRACDMQQGRATPPPEASNAPRQTPAPQTPHNEGKPPPTCDTTPAPFQRYGTAGGEPPPESAHGNTRATGEAAAGTSALLMGALPEGSGGGPSGRASPAPRKACDTEARALPCDTTPSPAEDRAPEPCDTKRATQAAPCDTLLHPDAARLLRLIEEHGPSTYGAAASDLGWLPTRAWRAEDRLLRAGLIHYPERDGRMHLRR